MQVLETAVANVGSDVDDFDTKNWREVVPEVKTSVEDLESAPSFGSCGMGI